jgi:hypothetical protein
MERGQSARCACVQGGGSSSGGGGGGGGGGGASFAGSITANPEAAPSLTLPILLAFDGSGSGGGRRSNAVEEGGEEPVGWRSRSACTHRPRCDGICISYAQLPACAGASRIYKCVGCGDMRVLV